MTADQLELEIDRAHAAYRREMGPLSGRKTTEQARSIVRLAVAHIEGVFEGLGEPVEIDLHEHSDAVSLTFSGQGRVAEILCTWTNARLKFHGSPMARDGIVVPLLAPDTGEQLCRAVCELAATFVNMDVDA